MKLVTFLDESGARLGVIQGARVIDVEASARRQSASAVDAAFASMQALIEGGEPALAALRALLREPSVLVSRPLDDVRLAAPLPRPIQIRDCLCFEEHLTNLIERVRASSGTVPAAQASMYETFKQRPIYYKANRFAVVGPDTDDRLARVLQAHGLRARARRVIGQQGKNLAPARCATTCSASRSSTTSPRVTSRARDGGPARAAKGKDFDGANVMGPCLVTADEFDETRAAMRVRVNGELRSEANSASTTLSFAT